MGNVQTSSSFEYYNIYMYQNVKNDILFTLLLMLILCTFQNTVEPENVTFGLMEIPVH